MAHPRFSVIIPVYNRPQETEELLGSLCAQTSRDFEVILVEDGSSLRSDAVADAFRDRLSIQYVFRPNAGPGPSRNAGFGKAAGDFFVVFDSDCILPPTYFEAVEKALEKHPLDAWGGPDRAHEKFTLLQRAMGYTMSSFLTTCGIRGGRKRMGWFQPRSFNMGISRQVYEATGGFQFDRFAEDIELSIRIRNLGFTVGLIREAYVYHKRRTNLSRFFRQVFNFGKGRAMIGRCYPEEVRLTHWFPAIFSAGLVIMLLLPFFSTGLFLTALALFLVYLTALVAHSLVTTRNIAVAVLSVPCALLQFVGYGSGFLLERLRSRKSAARG